MTYDLHGQWDYGNKYSAPGCGGLGCLRSHVNLTETLNALSMVTKAGVPSSKVIVGVSSYGRSFKMTTAGCDGPNCNFVGAESQAKPGACTGTAGYISNAEIQNIINTRPVNRQFLDDSHSDVLVYDNTEWVAYMSPQTKAARTAIYKNYNFGGTSDWAVDLADFTARELHSPAILSAIAQGNGKCKWRSPDGMNCLMVEVTNNLEIPRAVRWANVNADCAWNEWMTKLFKSGDFRGFASRASSFFNGPEKFDCEVIGGDCTGGTMQKCQDTRDSGPAGYFILNSLKSVNGVSPISPATGKPAIDARPHNYRSTHANSRPIQMFARFDAALVQVTALNSLRTETFTYTFAPTYKTGDDRLLGLDILGLAAAIVAPAVFNKGRCSACYSSADDI